MKTVSKALAAVLVAAFMCLVPLSVVDSADADFKDNDAGWSCKMDNPTDAELDTFHVDKTEVAGESLLILSQWINLNLFGAPTSCTMDSFYYAEGQGMDIDSDSVTEVYASEITIKDLKLEVLATKSGKIIRNIDEDTPEKDKAAMNAIYAYIGDIAIGDKVIVTGDITYEMSGMDEYSYKSIDDDTSVLTKYVKNIYMVADFDITMEVVKAGQTEGKSIDFVCDTKGDSEMKSEYTYDADFKDIVPSTTGKMENSVSYSFSGGAHFAVDGEDYDLDTDDNYEPDPSQDIIAMYYIVEDDEKVIDPDIKTVIAGLPDSTDNVKVGKEYSDAKSLYSDVKSDATKKKTNLVPIIIGVVVAVVVIGGIAAFFIMKKKKA